MSNPFRYFNSSPEVIRLVVMMYVGAVTGTRNGGAKAGSFSRDFRLRSQPATSGALRL